MGRAKKTQKTLTLSQLKQKLFYYRALADTYEAIQKLRIACSNRLTAIHKLGLDEEEKLRERTLSSIVDELLEQEKRIIKIVKEILKEIPIYNEFLKKIKGIGPALSLRLLSINWDLNKKLSDWNAYAGLVPYVYKCKCQKGHKLLLPYNPEKRKEEIKCYVITEREKKKKGGSIILDREKMKRCGAPVRIGEIAPCRKHSGYKIFWNPKAKKTLWLISTSLAKSGKFYKIFYEYWREKYLKEKLSLPHAVARAKRKVAKLFLAHFYEAWHEIEGMSYELPYQFEYLKHSPDRLLDWKIIIKVEEGEIEIEDFEEFEKEVSESKSEDKEKMEKVLKK